MPAIAESTTVTFPLGATSGRSRIVHLLDLGTDGVGVITEQTPFHPVDHAWPDQPGR